MFHRANELSFKKGTIVEIKFQDGVVKQYDMACLFDKYPQLDALKNRELFLSGRLSGFYGIIWNDDLDVDTESIYEEGKTVFLFKWQNRTFFRTCASCTPQSVIKVLL